MSWGSWESHDYRSPRDAELRSFKVKGSTTLTVLGIALIATAGLLLLLATLVGATELQATLRASPEAALLAGLGFISATIGVMLIVIGYVKHCANVEFLVRDAVDRRGGDAG